MGQDTVGAIAVLCIFGGPIAAFIIIRILAHSERIEMIRRGMVPPQGGGKRWNRMNAGPVPPPYYGNVPPVGPQMAYVPPTRDESPDSTLRRGIMTTLVGFAILIGLSFFGYSSSGPFNTPQFQPTPLLLGGLIPMFVGVAQIIVAVLSGARIGMAQNAPYSPPPHQAPPQPPPSYNTSASGSTYVYEPEPRVHNGNEELRGPAKPPDRI